MTKINKAAARKLWKEGKEFTIVACNLRPEYGITARPSWTKNYRDFDQFVDQFTVFNCGNNETGRYPAYYVED